MASHAAAVMELPWLLRVLLTASLCVTAALWSWTVVRARSPGVPRLLTAAPVVLVFWTVPWLFSGRPEEGQSLAACIAMFLWLATFKVLALCVDRGALAQAQLRRDQFCALLLWPVIPQEDSTGRVVEVLPAERGRMALARLVWRAPENLVIAVVGLWLLVQPWVPLFAKTYAGAFGVCCYCGLWANAVAALIIWAHGVGVAPSWDRPWLQSSLADFWGRRWNLPAAASLKVLVYDPVAEGRLVRQRLPTHPVAAAAAAAVAAVDSTPATEGGPITAAPSGVQDDVAAVAGGEEEETTPLLRRAKQFHATSSQSQPQRPAPRAPRASIARRAMATTATFLASGIMHEILLWYATGSTEFAGRQLLYFAMQAPLAVLEQLLKKAAAKRKVQLPVWASIPLTSLLLQVPGMWLFWVPYFYSVQPPPPPFGAILN